MGKIEWISVRPESKADVVPVTSVEATIEGGLDGDHKTQPHRQVTLISYEALQTVKETLGAESVDPGLTRRNVLISGIDFEGLEGKQMKVGDATLEITGPCKPCTRMDQNFGPGGLAAMHGKGGLTAKVLSSGMLRIGDSVEVL